MRSLIVTFLLISFIVSSAQETTLDKVKALNSPVLKKKINVFYSPGYKDRAKQVLSLMSSAKKFFEKKLDVKAPFQVAVLDKEHWEKINRIPYGIPFASDPPYVAFLPATDGILTMNMDEAKKQASESFIQQLSSLGYSFEEGERKGVDLIGLHELGHVFAETLGIVSFPPTNKWLGEFIATYFAYAYMREKEPNLARLWDVRTENMAAMTGLKYNSLEDFEKLYNNVGPQNYGWYQSKFSQLVKKIYDNKGLSFIQDLRQKPFAEKTPLAITDVVARLEAIAPGFIEWSKQMQ